MQDLIRYSDRFYTAWESSTAAVLGTPIPGSTGCSLNGSSTHSARTMKT